MTVMALSKPYSFETFPAEIRLAILRMLLLCDEDHEAIDVNDEGYGLHPAIMRCNKLIHEEAAGVLYGENVFVYFLDGLEHCKLWHSHSYWSNTKSLLSRRNSRLISMVYLNLDLVDNNGELSFDYERNDVDTLKSNIRHAVDTLSLSDLKILKIRCRDTYVSGTYDIHLNKWGDMPYFGQECLEDWLRARATRVSTVFLDVRLVPKHSRPLIICNIVRHCMERRGPKICGATQSHHRRADERHILRISSREGGRGGERFGASGRGSLSWK